MGLARDDPICTGPCTSGAKSTNSKPTNKNILRAVAARRILLLPLLVAGLFRLEGVVASSSSSSSSNQLGDASAMICERRDVSHEGGGSEKPPQTAIFCSFRIDDDDGSDGNNFRAAAFESCVWNSSDTEDCVEARVKVKNRKRSSRTTADGAGAKSETVETRTEGASREELATATETPKKDDTSAKVGMATASITAGADNTRHSKINDSPKPSPAGQIIVGEAVYRPPYREQYGSAVGDVLLDFSALGFEPGGLSDNDASIHLVDWYIELGNAHMDDAEFGVVFDDGAAGESNNHANLPKNYHIELAIQAYQWASKALFQMTSEEEFLALDPSKDIEEGDEEKMIRLQYYAVIEFAKGEAFAVAGDVGDGGYSTAPLSSGEEELYSSALKAYRKAQRAFEKLRYLYAKLASAASAESGNNDRAIHDEYFNEERYNLIENFYAHSCFQLGMSLYSKLIHNQNAEVIKSNEKVMDIVKSQFGLQADASEDEIVAALMDEANGGMGLGGGGGRAGGGGGGSSFAVFGADLDSLGDLGDLFGGDLLPDSEERNAQLLEIAGLLDTAILTYQQHAHPKKPSPSSEDGEKFKVILNGIRRKSMEELEEEERLFHWRSSLALAYQNAATIATARNQHIRSRELLNHALELYTDTILPYYSEQDVRERRLKRSRSNTDGGDIRGRHRGRGKLQTSSPNSMSTMTRGYAEVSAGHLYVTLADTAMKLGGYEDSKQAYSKAMDWHMQHKLSPTADGTFNSLYGDEMGLRQYKDFAETYVQELEQYWEDLRTGYVYRDDLYEAQILLTLAPLYMAMGQAAPAIRYYKKAITAYESSTTGDLTNESNKLAVLSLGDSHFGLATAYFHAGRYTESKEQHVKSCNIYQRVYGEGTPPQPEGEAAIEDMKDLIIDNYGEEYYEQLKAYYDGSGTGTGGGAGIGGDGGSNPKLATNFDIQGYHNETLEEDIEEEEKEDYEDTGVNWSNDEL